MNSGQRESTTTNGCETERQKGRTKGDKKTERQKDRKTPSGNQQLFTPIVSYRILSCLVLWCRHGVLRGVPQAQVQPVERILNPSHPMVGPMAAEKKPLSSSLASMPVLNSYKNGRYLPRKARDKRRTFETASDVVSSSSAGSSIPPLTARSRQTTIEKGPETKSSERCICSWTNAVPTFQICIDDVHHTA